MQRITFSIQVHPSDEYALKNEGEYGKTEVWYVLSAEPGAALYYGFNREITKDEYRRRIAADNTITEVLNRVEPRRGMYSLLSLNGSRDRKRTYDL